MRTIFLDRDGVINENLSTHVKSWSEFRFIPHALTALRWLRQAHVRVFVVTNQAIVNRGLVSPAMLDDIHARMIARVEAAGGWITDIRYCPHDDHEHCTCRKPRPGMLLDLAREWGVDLSETYFVGDALTDVAAAHAAGCGAIMVRTGRGDEQLRHAQAHLHQPDYVAPNLLSAVQWFILNESRELVPALGAAD